jgi:DNA-binding response OmpR family regulator
MKSMLTVSSFETVPLAEIVRKGLVAETTPHRPVVLIVDDEQVIADTRAAIFSSWGYATMAAYDAESALELADVIPPELLVSDVILTGMNGVDLAIAIKTSVPDCKVLLLSGQPAGVDMLAAARNAGHDFTLLLKPLHPARLLAQLSKMDLESPGGPAMET